LRELRLGTRGSALALAQTALAEAALRAAHPELKVTTQILTTSGDKRGDAVTTAEGGVKGLFTKELEEALLGGRIDAAVHSLKDLPGHIPEGLVVAAVLERAGAEDVLVSKAAGGLGGLRVGAVVGTGSVRRKMQLLRMRADLDVREVRGNVPTRLRKLREDGELDAIVLAWAGLERLGFTVEESQLHVEVLVEMLPAIGQGAIALEARRDDAETMQRLGSINHRATYLCIRAEREFLRLLDGDCDLPVGARTALRGTRLSIKAIVFDGEQGAPRTGEAEGDDPERVANDLFKMLHAH
jgi:hydroxymethylbilane synthase